MTNSNLEWLKILVELAMVPILLYMAKIFHVINNLSQDTKEVKTVLVLTKDALKDLPKRKEFKSDVYNITTMLAKSDTLNEVAMQVKWNKNLMEENEKSIDSIHRHLDSISAKVDNCFNGK